MNKPVEVIPLMLACNDYRSGVFEGILSGVQLVDSEILDLETCLVDEEDVDELSGIDIVFTPKNCFTVVSGDDACTVPILGRKFWVGNWCWDCVLVELPELVKFLNWLMKTNTFWCINGIDVLHDAWHDMEPIAEDLLRDILAEG